MSEAKQGKIEPAAKKSAPKKAPEKAIEAVENIDPRERQAQRLEADRIKNNKMVRGKFTFHEVPGGKVTMPYRRHKKDGIKWYTFEDGKIYTIPLGLAKHLNEGCRYPVHSHKVEANWMPGVNRPEVVVGKFVDRMSFVSLDFIDASDPDACGALGPQPTVLTAEHR